MTIFGMTDEDKKTCGRKVEKYAQFAKSKGGKKKNPSLSERVKEYGYMFTIFIHLNDVLGSETVKELRSSCR